MSTTTRSFGLTRRSNSTPLRQQPNGDKWAAQTQVPVPTPAAEGHAGPVPTRREFVERKFTTYCRLSLGHPRNTVPKKVILLKQVFILIHDADKHSCHSTLIRR